MSSAERDALPSLLSAFQNRAHRLHLFPALRYLKACFPNAASPGTRGPFHKERLQFQQDYQLAFATQEIEQLRLDDELRVQLRSRVLALCSADSPLPDSMLHELARQDEREDRGRAYLDLFYHRFFGFLYRGRCEQDLAGQCLLSLGQKGLPQGLTRLGLGPMPEGEALSPGPQQSLAVSALLTGHTATCARIASACRAILSARLPAKSLARLAIRVREFQGGRSLCAPQYWSRLGGPSVCLGQSAHLGQHSFQPASAVCIELAGLDKGSLAAFEAQSELQRELRVLMDRCTPLGLHAALELGLRCSPDQQANLGRSRLGQDSWLAGTAPLALRLRTIPLKRFPER